MFFFGPCLSIDVWALQGSSKACPGVQANYKWGVTDQEYIWQSFH